ncbi:hypothetical protein LUZ63_000465 [Rhynchospora breviuscula]|uniref:RWP-RK domain-containing protein n=1 Tax=Rhynchospora breviuscula TaxID=2022672 RepID=A0A9Q0CV31_9POAL|nr:hypothetical protein LUZ63_000465 [Rhynchospora breviuscula]
MAPILKLSNRLYAISDLQAPTNSMNAPMIFLMQPLHPLYTVEGRNGQVGGHILHSIGGVSEVQHRSPRLLRRNVLTLEHLAEKFSMPIKDAADEFKLSVTTLMLRCRELGFEKWPFRRMQSLEHLIDDLLEMKPSGFQDAVAEIRQEIEAIKLNPSLDIKDETKHLRQQMYQLKSKRRRMD